MKVLTKSPKIMLISGPIGKISDHDLRYIVEQIPKYHAVIAKNQIFSKIELGEFIHRIGESDTKKAGLFYNETKVPSLIRVSNERDRLGNKTGIFEDKELGWHCNGASRKKSNEITLILFCENPGERNHGITSFCDMRQAYFDLPAKIKRLADEIEVKTDFKTFSGNNPSLHYSHTGYNVSISDPEFKAFHPPENDRSVFINSCESIFKPLVRAHPYDKKKSLYFIPSAISDWRHKQGLSFNSEKLWKFLREHCYSEKYVYHHQWTKGDLLFNDQWHYMHKRAKTKGNRMMWRFCVNNDNILKL